MTASQPGYFESPKRWVSRQNDSTAARDSRQIIYGVDVPPEWSRQRVLLAVALWVLGIIVLAIMSVFAHQYSEFPGDVAIAETIQKIQQPAIKSFINFASDANWPNPAGVTAVVVIVVLALFRHIRAAICTAISGFGADLINVTLNGIVARPRPNNVHIHAVAHLGLHSYPSGHVTHVIAFYGFLLYLSHRALVRLGEPAYEAERRRGSWLDAFQAHPAWRIFLAAVRVICVYFIIFIGISRVLEGEHWPSDVVASYLLGALVLTLAIWIYHAWGVGWLHATERRHGSAAIAR